MRRVLVNLFLFVGVVTTMAMVGWSLGLAIVSLGGE